MKKLFYFSIAFIGLLMCPSSNVNAQGVGVNSTGAPANNSAGLDVDFTNKGALLPRMSSTDRDNISNPATGLIIYNTDCGVYNFNAGTPSSPDWEGINSSGSVIAGVSVLASPSTPICSGTSVTFTAVPASGINSPNYQWQVNGGNVGSNSSTYSNSSLNNGDVVTCILTVTQSCVSGSSATSAPITMIVHSVPGTPVMNAPIPCINTTNNIYSVTPIAGATYYNWSVPSIVLPVNSGLGTSSISINLGPTTGYIGSIGVSASNECGSSATDTVSVTVSPAAPATPGTITGTVHGFINTTGNSYSISAVTNATTYTWSTPGWATVSGGQGATSTTVDFGAGTGSFELYVTAGNICGTSTPDSLAVSLCSQNHGTQTFTYTGNVQTFTVQCATSITIAAYGGMGAYALCCNYGYGGYATGTLTVTPQEQLYVYIGGAANGSTYGTNSGGGGYGGSASYAAGGGATDVRTSLNDLNTRVIVAGGGGGSNINANSSWGSYPGGGGGLNGINSTDAVAYYWNGSYYEYCYGATGGTQSGGGNGGAGYTYPSGGSTGNSGGFGYGGSTNATYEGGGGGGYYGGGAGGYCGLTGSYSCGAGGSSYVGSLGSTSTIPNVNGPTSAYSGNGYVVITW